MSGSPEMLAGFPGAEVKPELKREVQRIAFLGVSFLVVFAALLSVLEGPLTVLRWLLLGLACWGFVLWQCYQRLHLNVSASIANGPAISYVTLGHGNRITLLRGLLISAVAGFLVISPGDHSSGLMYLPAVLYTAAALGDLLDGSMARRQQQTTRLGTELDTALDAFGLLIAPLLAVAYGKLHVSYLLVSIAYYLFQWRIYWRRRQALPVHSLPPSRMRRYLAGLQMALVAAALWPPLPGVATSVLGAVLMLPLLIGFCRDWWYVSGRSDGYPERCS